MQALETSLPSRHTTVAEDTPASVELKIVKKQTLTKADLVETLNKRIGFNKNEARLIVDVFFEVISDCLTSGENVKLAGFGNFQLRDKGMRPGRNPKTGKAIEIEARRVVTFHANPSLKLTIGTLLEKHFGR